MSPNIRDVARHAGVSVASVSRVLNGYPHVAVAVRGRVLEAIRELGYSPNYVARSMRLRATRMLGFLERDVRNPNFAHVCEAAEAVAGQLGYTLLLCNSNQDPDKELGYINLLLRHRVDGFIIFVANEHINNLKPVLTSNVPFVLVDSEVGGISTDRVTTDSEHGVYVATRHLMQLGHRAIGIIPGSQRILPGRARYYGYLRALQEVGITSDTRLVRFGDFDEESGEREMLYLLSMGDERPTAIIAGSNQITVGCLRAIQRHGIRIPHNLSFVGFDDTDIANLFAPPLTVISRPIGQMGVQAVTLLVDRLAGRLQVDTPQHIVVPCELIVRESSMPPAC